MSLRQVVPGLHQLSLGIVNVFLIEEDDGITLVDTGTAGKADRILNEASRLGYGPEGIRNIIVTHCHADHTGSLAELQRRTGATVAMHPVDAALTQEGRAVRPLAPAPGLIRGLLVRTMMSSFPTEVEPADIHVELSDRQQLDIAGGLEVIEAPGHSAGHIGLRWNAHGGVLFAADSCANFLGLGYSIVYEDLEEGRQTLGTLSQYSFEVAVFGHGRPITRNAAALFRRTWAQGART